MAPGRIRPLALAVIRHAGHILVVEGYDPLRDHHYYRPLGGGIEFGERGVEAVVREFREELGAALTAPRYLGTLENLFTDHGRPGHEIVLLYEAALADPALYAVPAIHAREDDGTEFTAVWKPLAEFRGAGPPLYPDGLLDLLTAGDDHPATGLE